MTQFSIDDSSLLQPSTAPFQTLGIDLSDDIALSDGTFIGDAVQFAFGGGSATFNGELIQQLAFKLQDSTGTMIDGVDLDQIFGLELADSTSNSFLMVTEPFSIPTGTLTSVEVTVIPIPAALPLFGSALAALGLIGWRRRS